MATDRPTIRPVVFAALMMGSLCLPRSITATENASAKSPNILIIVSDDLGYSDLGCFGGEIDTPHLDQLAANGVRMTQFYTTGRCCPSRASLLTGHYPHRVGLGHMTQDIGRPGYRGRVNANAPTIAEVLANAGYRSFISGKWHLGTSDPTLHGFEEFYGTLTSAKTFWDPDHFIRLPKGRDKVSATDKSFYGTDAITDHALSFLKIARKTPGKPWFLYLAYNAPHFPLQAPKDDIQKYASTYQHGWDQLRESRFKRMKQLGVIPKSAKLSPRSPFWNYGETRTGANPAWRTLPPDRQADLARRMAIYAAMVDRMDANFGRITDDLNTRNELDNTLIIFLSDNGACAEWDPFGFDIKSSNQNILYRSDQLDEMGTAGTFHSAGSGWANGSNTPFRLYKHFCHQGGVISPCIVHWPQGLSNHKNEICHVPGHLIDLLPTAMSVAKANYPAKRYGKQSEPIPGQNLLSLIQEPSTSARTIFLEHEGNRGLRHGRWKLSALKNEAWELYDLDADPTELNDLAESHPDLVNRLSAKWKAWAKDNHVTPLPDDYQVKYLKPTMKGASPRTDDGS